jgi:hypothetical protein
VFSCFQTALIMELCENQSLCRLIEKANPVPTQLPWSRRLALAFDASCGMVYLHARGNFRMFPKVD